MEMKYLREASRIARHNLINRNNIGTYYRQCGKEIKARR